MWAWSGYIEVVLQCFQKLHTCAHMHTHRHTNTQDLNYILEKLMVLRDFMAAFSSATGSVTSL